jgi:thiopeptide-type bacteriocin biosynthesis protein
MQADASIKAPNDASMDGDWLSAHIGFPGTLAGANADQIVVNIVAPFIRKCRTKGWTRSYFFVRYADPDPHIRLRIKVASALVQETSKALGDHIDRLRATEQKPVCTSVNFIPYEPELHRYGGAAALIVAEELFCASSNFAVSVLCADPLVRHSARLGKGALGMLTLLHAFVPTNGDAAEFARWYATQYLKRVFAKEASRQGMLESFGLAYEQQATRLMQFIGSAFAALQSGESVSENLDAYRQSVCAARDSIAALAVGRHVTVQNRIVDDWGSCVRHLLPSYLHMANNRLGISIPEEAYLAYVIHRALVTRAPQFERVK